MEVEDRVWLYFDKALKTVSEAKIVEAFANNFKDIKPAVNKPELLKYTYQDWGGGSCIAPRVEIM